MTHNMKLHLQPFEMIKNGEKIYELRLYDEKRRQINLGDKIIFTNKNGEELKVKVVGLHKFSSFKELYQALPLEKCGYLKEELATASFTDMLEYYSISEQEKYGVLAIEIALI